MVRWSLIETSTQNRVTDEDVKVWNTYITIIRYRQFEFSIILLLRLSNNQLITNVDQPLSDRYIYIYIYIYGRNR